MGIYKHFRQCHHRTKYDHVYIDSTGDSPDIISGYFENGIIEVYQNADNEKVRAITIDKKGKELELKNYHYSSDLLEDSYN